MEATPLASLTLTHVHYVSPPPPSSPSLYPPAHHPLPPPTESPRPHILPLRLARPDPPNPLRNLRHPTLVHARDRNPPHVHRPNGLRSAQLPAEAAHQRREAETYVQNAPRGAE